MLVCALVAAAACAEVSTVRIARNFGTAYLQLMIMQNQSLVEKHARRAMGLGDIKVEWTQFAAGAHMNDALLAGKLDIASGGVPPFLTLWSPHPGQPERQGHNHAVLDAALSRHAQPEQSSRCATTARRPHLGRRRGLVDPDDRAADGSGQGVRHWSVREAEIQHDQFFRTPTGSRRCLPCDKQVESLLSAPPYQNQALENGRGSGAC
jgi:hypothetical protein